MNIIDIIILVALAVALVIGLKDGAIRQLSTLAGIIAAILLAKKFGTTVSAMLGIGGDYAHIWGYAIVLIVSLIFVGLAAGLLRKIISAVGLGIIDRIAGGVISMVKYALILSVAFSLFAMVNNLFGLVDKQTFDESHLYGPIVSSSKYVMPAVEWIGGQLPLDGQEHESQETEDNE